MAVGARTIPQTLLTYDAYLSEPESQRRYEILDGARSFMTNPSRDHQRCLFRIARAFDDYERTDRAGQVIVAPCDVLIRRDPLRTRQPDLLFISHERLSQCRPGKDPAPLLVGPELVVEILSPSESRRTIVRKVSDYASVGVREIWIVDLNAGTVETVRLTASGAETIDIVGRGGEARSDVFAGLVVPVDRIFDI